MSPVIVYSKPDCVQCHYTKVQLERNHVPYNEIDASPGTDAAKMLQDKGFQSLPVVVTEHETWQGFKLDKLRGLHQS